jgi:pimeloyl-ACP methyl ester carboxylesterase
LPFIEIDNSPLVPKVSPVRIHYREAGSGQPLVFLHGGWGYQIYPFDRQIETFAGKFKIIIPDRSGYGRSVRMESIPADFHRRAAVEVRKFIDALGLDRPVLWGHSDGAVIAALMGLADARRYRGLIMEAFHYYRMKPSSRDFFETMAKAPERLGKRASKVLADDHGEDYWRGLIVNNGLAWLRIAKQSRHPKDDLYEDRLGELAVPAIFIHGSGDPRTEPDELAAVRRAIPQAPIHLIEGGGHSPHSEVAAYEECNRIASEFLRNKLLAHLG